MLLAIALASQTWTMVIGGDIMLNGLRPSAETFKAIEAWTTKADIATANLEIPLTTSAIATRRKTAADLAARNQYILKADPKHVASLRTAGFDLLGLANNHAMDYGYAGVKQMQGLLEKNGIAWCGSGKDIDQAARPRIVTLSNGFRVAYLAFLAFRTPGGLGKCTPATSTSAGVATLPALPVSKGGDVLSRQVKTAVRSAKRVSDMVVVHLHWGTEKRPVPDLWQAQLGRRFIEAGADCVIGNHPHVLQGAELYAGKPLFYSLGNLVSPRPATTAIFRLTFEGKKLKKTEIMPLSISGGRIRAVAAGQRPSRLSAYQSLSRQAVVKYRHPKAKALTIE